jgi:hypothetical protein
LAEGYSDTFVNEEEVISSLGSGMLLLLGEYGLVPGCKARKCSIGLDFSYIAVQNLRVNKKGVVLTHLACAT